MQEPKLEDFNKTPEAGAGAVETEAERMARRIIEAQELRIQELETKIGELKYENKRLKELSTHDPLTGILNRRGAEERIELINAVSNIEEEKRSRHEKKSRRKFSILSLDIDHFKAVNDTYGHEAGDVVLKKLSDFLKSITRKSDMVARWGGEEFLIVFYEIDAQRALNKFFNEEYRAEEHRTKKDKGSDNPENPTAQISFPVEIETKEGEKITITVTLSGGVTDYVPGEDFKKATERADQALYKSKEEGRNRITKYEEPGQGK